MKTLDHKLEQTEDIQVYNTIVASQTNESGRKMIELVSKVNSLVCSSYFRVSRAYPSSDTRITDVKLALTFKEAIEIYNDIT